MLEFEHLFKSSDITSSVSKAGRSSEDAASGNNRGEAFKTIFEDSWNELEWLYASSFFKKYKIKPKVIDVELTKRG